MRNLLIVLVVLSGVVGLNACKKKSTAVNFHYDYFPMTQDHYVIYEVDYLYKDNFLTTDHFFIKAVIGDTLTDNEGRIVRRYLRYRGESANGPWNLQDIWTTVIANGRAELVEENQRKIKMVFAPDKTKEWNANAFNSLDPLNCYYDGIHKSRTIGNFQLDSTVRVLQDTTYNFVEYRLKYEVYAKNIGMVKSVFQDYTTTNYDTINFSKGTKIIYTMVDYGH